MPAYDDADFGYDDDPSADAMIAAVNALGRRDLHEARRALAVAERLKPSSQLAFEALSLLDAGLSAEAARRIDLFLHPKFASHDDCVAAYRKAMRPQRELFPEAAQ